MPRASSRSPHRHHGLAPRSVAQTAQRSVAQTAQRRVALCLAALTGVLFAGVLLAAAGSSFPKRAQASPAEPSFPAFPLAFHVSHVDGVPVVDQAFLDERVDAANSVFGRHGITFQAAAFGSLDEKHARIDTRRDRHRLGGLVSPGVVNVFVVASLRDVDEPSTFRRGVHWRSRTHEGVHYVILSKISGIYVLAHELGHFFGNREHAETPGNIMSYSRAEGVPFLDRAQIAIAHRTAQRYLDTKEIVVSAPDANSIEADKRRSAKPDPSKDSPRPRTADTTTRR